jgi:hypothetical protein
LALAELIADMTAERVLERLSAGDAWSRAASDGLATAAEVAVALNVSRRFVYELRDELGAQALGTGSRPRLRCDL